MKVKISAVVITFNEERNIERCLKSLVGVVDELVVVDSYSTDRTEEICKLYHARFIKHRFEGHIQQKNWAILQASSPYILSLDADEVLSDELKTSILKVKEEWAYDGYYFNRLTNYCGHWIRHCGWYPDRKIRLFPKDKAEWEGDHVHEELVLTEGTRKTWINGDLHHYSYYTTIEHRERAMKYARLGAEKVKHKRGLGLKLLFSPPFRFIQMYLLQGGFKDGRSGFDICRITAWEVAQKYKLGIRAPSA
jgi:glycosyltransferase involved in cell wall biosynthesis